MMWLIQNRFQHNTWNGKDNTLSENFFSCKKVAFLIKNNLLQFENILFYVINIPLFLYVSLLVTKCIPGKNECQK